MAGKIDREAVLAAFDRLKNARAVAREMGLHRNTVGSIVRKSRGVCVRCQAPVAPGKTSCAKCLLADQERTKLRRRSRRRLGLCQLCDNPHSAVSKIYCDEHRLIDLDWRQHEYTSKRGARHNGIPSESDRRSMLIAKYGDGAWRCWIENNGCCEACGTSYEVAAVHIHHIDEDKTHNVRENFACLCFFCHRATHLLISSKSRQGLIAWFERTYPDRTLR